MPSESYTAVRTGPSGAVIAAAEAPDPTCARTSFRAELAGAGVREFALILTHPKLRGATVAWTSPIALV